MSAIPIELIRRADNEFVAAELLEGIRPEDLALVERVWGPERLRIYQSLLKSGVPRGEWPESLHWDWTKKAKELKLLASSGFGIVCEGAWQGVLLAKTAGCAARLANEKGKPIVYLDYLETAPWNWPIQAIVQAGTYRSVGSVLFRQAVVLSMKEGFHGRVGLHSLPQAERFYEHVCGMTPVARDTAKQNLLYFEFTREQAQNFLDDQGGDA